jgi:hypothetical protein
MSSIQPAHHALPIAATPPVCHVSRRGWSKRPAALNVDTPSRLHHCSSFRHL